MIRFIFFMAFIATLLVSCQSVQDSKTVKDDTSTTGKIIVKTVLQTEKYTFLQVEGAEVEKWLAVPKMEAKAGDTYYYHGGFERADFVSKELSKTFKSILFVEAVSISPDMNTTVTAVTTEAAKVSDTTNAAPPYRANVVVEKRAVKIKPDAGGITIAELFAHKTKYEGKSVKITGKVTKYNSGILNKNWIHIQDGTEFSGKFDLTATTATEAAVDQTITLEGKISLNRDFGYGYFYEVMMEDATFKNK